MVSRVVIFMIYDFAFLYCNTDACIYDLKKLQRNQGDDLPFLGQKWNYKQEPLVEWLAYTPFQGIRVRLTLQSL